LRQPFNTSAHAGWISWKKSFSFKNLRTLQHG
jgi:hypothetical protein